MRKGILRIKGIGFILWHAKHEFFHVVLGLLWAWFLRERWNEFNPRWIWISVFGSLIPDIDHFFYFFGYGKTDSYTKQIRLFLAARKWRALTVYVEHGHKRNTSLSTHNVYTMAILLVTSLLCARFDWEVGVILFGAMLTHYTLDFVDDILILGHVNPNWKRWGRPRAASIYTNSS